MQVKTPGSWEIAWSIVDGGPIVDSDNWQREIKGFFPGGRVRSLEDVVDFLFLGRFSGVFARFVPGPQAEVQTAFLTVIDMAMEDE